MKSTILIRHRFDSFDTNKIKELVKLQLQQQ